MRRVTRFVVRDEFEIGSPQYEALIRVWVDAECGAHDARRDGNHVAARAYATTCRMLIGAFAVPVTPYVIKS